MLIRQHVNKLVPAVGCQVRPAWAGVCCVLELSRIGHSAQTRAGRLPDSGVLVGGRRADHTGRHRNGSATSPRTGPTWPPASTTWPPPACRAVRDRFRLCREARPDGEASPGQGDRASGNGLVGDGRVGVAPTIAIAMGAPCTAARGQRDHAAVGRRDHQPPNTQIGSSAISLSRSATRRDGPSSG